MLQRINFRQLIRRLALLVIILLAFTIGTADSLSAATSDQTMRLGLQHRLDYDAPLYDATFIGTHNSYNNGGDGYNNFDPTLRNHDRSLLEQLNNGARALSFDLTYWDINSNVYQCHQACGVGDKPLSYGRDIVANWLTTHPNEVVIIVIEQSFGFSDSHQSIAASIFNSGAFGSMLFGPEDYSGSNGSCRELPLQDLTKQDILDAGKNILLLEPGCGDNSSWKNLVWDLPVAAYDKSNWGGIGRTAYRWDVLPEDRTSLPSNKSDNTFSSADVRTALNRGAAIIGLDDFVVTNRHDGLIWSWNPGQPDNSAADRCARSDSNGRWSDANCATTLRYACQNVLTGGWAITSAPGGTWSGGQAACNSVSPSGAYIFSTPINANNNAALNTVKGSTAVWLNYTYQEVAAGVWDWKVNDFVDVTTLPAETTFRFNTTASFEYFKIPTDTPYNRVEISVKGGNGGTARVKVKYCCGANQPTRTASGGQGEQFKATFAIGNGTAFPPGSGLGIVLGNVGQSHYLESTCDPFCAGKYATGGGGGGSAVLVYRPVNYAATTPVGPSWEPLVVAAGGGGGFRELDHGDNGDTASSFVNKGQSAAGTDFEYLDTQCAGGGGGAFHDDVGGIDDLWDVIDALTDDEISGAMGLRTYGEPGNINRHGGRGYGAGGATGTGLISGAGGGGGYQGGNGDGCGGGGPVSNRGGKAGASYIHASKLSSTDAAFNVSLPGTTATVSSSTIADGVVVVKFSIFNRAPVADADNYSVDEDNVLTKDAANGVLNGDTDADNDPLTAVKDTNPSNGSLTWNTNGSFTYTPNANYCGSDSFTYHANDGRADSNVATVSLTVHCVNDAPSFTASNPPAVNEDSGLQTATVATNFNPGPANESTQTVHSYPISNITGGSLLSTGPSVNNNGILSYTPAPNKFGTVTFNLQVKDNGGTSSSGVDTSAAQLVTIIINPVNDAPVATNNNYTKNEDTQLTGNVLTDGTPDSDIDGDTLSAVKDSNPSHGTLVLNANGSFTYDPDLNYCGSDSFTYHATDNPPITSPAKNSNVATVSISVTCVNDPPLITTVSPASQTIDYSDHIGQVTISATDVDNTSLTLSQTGAPASLPAPTLASTVNCTTVPNPSIVDGSTCTWNMDGQVTDPESVYNIDFTANDGLLDSLANPSTTRHTLAVKAELATVSFDSANPVAVQAAAPGSDSGQFTLKLYVVETEPDLPRDGSIDFGEISKAVVSMDLVPVAQGGTESGTCTQIGVTGTGYDQVLEVDCVFTSVPVNVYAAEATVDGGYYTGFGEDALVIFDPSLGFTTGGGWFYWPDSEDESSGYLGDRTNVGYNMKYNKKGTRVQGSLLMIRHLADGSKYRIKSNSLDGLALGAVTGPNPYDWASFNGKSTYLEPGWSDPIGNHSFTAYVEDYGEPGSDPVTPDRIWIELRDKGGLILPSLSLPRPADTNAIDLLGGNIVVPHTKGKK